MITKEINKNTREKEKKRQDALFEAKHRQDSYQNPFHPKPTSKGTDLRNHTVHKNKAVR